MRMVFVMLFLALILAFGCVEFGNGWVKLNYAQKEYVCPDGTTVASPSLCAGGTGNVSMSNCASTATLSSLTSNLMTQSSECRNLRVMDLCGKCASCCSDYQTAKTEYDQENSPGCYSCASANFNGVARARDFYDRMGVYENKCTEDCPSLVTAYQGLLQYAKDNNCKAPAGYGTCDDVTLP
ncbi:MAG: hypothetical protein WC488_02395 [Candidatus Micrarchaeia archaeon]